MRGKKFPATTLKTITKNKYRAKHSNSPSALMNQNHNIARPQQVTKNNKLFSTV
jgi:hypothetical protein